MASYGTTYRGDLEEDVGLLNASRNDIPTKPTWARRGGTAAFISMALVIGVLSIATIQSTYGPDASEENFASQVTSPDDISGGNWSLVRCVSSSQGSWHPATDNLRGNETYGVYNDDYRSNETFSVLFNESDTKHYLMALTDFSSWVVAEKGTLFEYGAPTHSKIIMSSASAEPYYAEWYIREGNPEDPWVSVYDHFALDPGMVYGENSKTGHMEHLGVGGIGACVWVRSW
mmetsp:Transcript_54419/g.124067  ORF Transcript_54419/g.124067 Transcript_54419/m.124067 type:complete len:231 (+) Transcript_54419:353-1045(+)